MQTQDVLDYLRRYREKYYSLVWLERCPVDKRPGACSGAGDRIARAYATEVAELRSEDRPFYHGFNSGCLAALRLAEQLLVSPSEEDVNDYAVNWFPELDTVSPPKEAE
jgi:hypothetical protein